jgi:hypothetical protein
VRYTSAQNACSFPYLYVLEKQISRAHSEPFGWRTAHDRQRKADAGRRINETRSDKTFVVDRTSDLLKQSIKPKFHSLNANRRSLGVQQRQQRRREMNDGLSGIETGGSAPSDSRSGIAGSSSVTGTARRTTAYRKYDPRIAIPVPTNVVDFHGGWQQQQEQQTEAARLQQRESSSTSKAVAEPICASNDSLMRAQHQQHLDTTGLKGNATTMNNFNTGLISSGKTSENNALKLNADVRNDTVVEMGRKYGNVPVQTHYQLSPPSEDLTTISRVTEMGRRSGSPSPWATEILQTVNTPYSTCQTTTTNKTDSTRQQTLPLTDIDERAIRPLTYQNRLSLETYSNVSHWNTVNRSLGTCSTAGSGNVRPTDELCGSYVSPTDLPTDDADAGFAEEDCDSASREAPVYHLPRPILGSLNVLKAATAVSANNPVRRKHQRSAVKWCDLDDEKRHDRRSQSVPVDAVLENQCTTTSSDESESGLHSAAVPADRARRQHSAPPPSHVRCVTGGVGECIVEVNF